MSSQNRRRIAALFEVLGVYLVGAFLNDKIVHLLLHLRFISLISPFSLLTVHTTNADLLVASHQLLLVLARISFSYFGLIIAIDRWRQRRGPATYGPLGAIAPWRQGLRSFPFADMISDVG